MNSISTLLDERVRPNVELHCGSAGFMLYKKTISSSSCGRPWRVGMAGDEVPLVALTFRRRLAWDEDACEVVAEVDCE